VVRGSWFVNYLETWNDILHSAPRVTNSDR
jgi:hypothetical protein